MNVWHGIGNLGKDPIHRSTASGRSVLNFSMAVDRRVRTGEDSSGNAIYEKRPDWIPVVVFGSRADQCARYLQKGSKVLVTCSLRPRRWTDSEGITHSAFEVDASGPGGNIEFLAKIRSNDQASTADSDTIVTDPCDYSG